MAQNRNIGNCGSGPGTGVLPAPTRVWGADMADERLTGANRRPVQRQRVGHGWTQARREAFLDHVSATCNVRAACEAVGLSQASLYSLRRRDPAFADQWRMALLAGYDRLEGELLHRALNPLEEVAVGDPDRVIAGPVTFDQALALLDRHRRMLKNENLGQRDTQYRATQAETDAMLKKRLRSLRQKFEGRT